MNSNFKMRRDVSEYQQDSCFALNKTQLVKLTGLETQQISKGVNNAALFYLERSVLHVSLNVFTG